MPGGEVVRRQLAIDKSITECGDKSRTGMASSGEVSDKESGPAGFTENSHALIAKKRPAVAGESFLPSA